MMKCHSDLEHHPHGPSKWPKWAKCGAYVGKSEQSDAAARGTLIHERFAEYIQTGAYSYSQINESDKEALNWATVEYDKLARFDKVESEKRVHYNQDGFEYFGTVDALIYRESGDVEIIDLKTGQIRDYYEQMCGYALAVMQEHFRESIVVHVIYCDGRYTDTHRINWKEAREIMQTVLVNKTACENGQMQPTPCEYCGWCARAAECPALHGVLNDQLAQRANILDRISLSTPEEVGKCLAAFDVLAPLKNAARERAIELHKEGREIPNVRITVAEGIEKITDVNDVWQNVGTAIGAAKWNACCNVSVSKLRSVWSEFSKDPFPVESAITRGPQSYRVAITKNKPALAQTTPNG